MKRTVTTDWLFYRNFSVPHLVYLVGLSSSVNEARRLIKQNAVRAWLLPEDADLDDEPVLTILGLTAMLPLLPDLVLKAGKKVVRVKLADETVPRFMEIEEIEVDDEPE